MARPDKVAAVADVKDRFESSAALLLTNYRGLTVGELAELRAELRKANASYRVSKNTLIRRAMHDAGVEGLDEMLVGPTALVFCADDPVGPAKALKAFTKDHPQLEFKGGFLEGGVLDADAALKLADLESREDLLTRLAGLMHGALANTARLLAALPEKQARLLQALVDAGGFAGGDGAEATEAADQAAAATTDDEPEAAADADADEPEAAADDANADADEPVATTDDEPEAAADEPTAEADDEPEASDESDADESDADES
ncbi:50S ribosomal protein L10 [Nitriliruptoria bacterium AS10]|nr:50S ribosomal protein L10 [Salsipaludibacter albus]